MCQDLSLLPDLDQLGFTGAVTSPISNIAFVPVRHGYPANALSDTTCAARVDGGIYLEEFNECCLVFLQILVHL